MSELDTATIVAQKLQASRTAHASYRFARFEQKNLVEAKANLEMAMRLRREAIAIDPQRSAPAWRGEQDQTAPSLDTNDSLIAFYESEIAKLA